MPSPSQLPVGGMEVPVNIFDMILGASKATAGQAAYESLVGGSTAADAATVGVVNFAKNAFAAADKLGKASEMIERYLLGVNVTTGSVQGTGLVREAAPVSTAAATASSPPLIVKAGFDSPGSTGMFMATVIQSRKFSSCRLSLIEFI